MNVFAESECFPGKQLREMKRVSCPLPTALFRKELYRLQRGFESTDEKAHGASNGQIYWHCQNHRMGNRLYEYSRSSGTDKCGKMSDFEKHRTSAHLMYTTRVLFPSTTPLFGISVTRRSVLFVHQAQGLCREQRDLTQSRMFYLVLPQPPLVREDELLLSDIFNCHVLARRVTSTFTMIL